MPPSRSRPGAVRGPHPRRRRGSRPYSSGRPGTTGRPGAASGIRRGSRAGERCRAAGADGRGAVGREFRADVEEGKHRFLLRLAVGEQGVQERREHRRPLGLGEDAGHGPVAEGAAIRRPHEDEAQPLVPGVAVDPPQQILDGGGRPLEPLGEAPAVVHQAPRDAVAPIEGPGGGEDGRDLRLPEAGTRGAHVGDDLEGIHGGDVRVAGSGPRQARAVAASAPVRSARTPSTSSRTSASSPSGAK